MTRWIAAGGAFVVSLDSTVNIAFPAMAAAFAVPPEQLRWVIVGYVLAYALLSFAGGAAGDRLGHRPVFLLGLLGSAVGYTLAGQAATFGWLLAGRVVQGIAGGLVYGTAPALATLGASGIDRGRALGFLNGAIGLALTLGPLLAGGLVERFGWAAVFHLRIPLAGLLLLWAGLALPGGGPPGRASLPRLAALGRLPVVLPGLLAFVANGGIFAVWLLAPFYLVDHRGLPATLAGALLMLAPLGLTVGAPLAARLAERLGEPAVVAAGLALEAAGLAGLSRAGADTAVGWLAAGLLAAGLGLGVFQVPNMSALMARFPAGQQGAAGGLAFMARTLGVVAGVLALGRLFGDLRAARGFDAAFAGAFLLAAAAVAAAAALALGAVLSPSWRRPTGGSSWPSG